MSEATLRRLWDELGELVARHDQTRSLERFHRWAEDPVGFMTDVLHLELWERQTEVARLIQAHRLVRVRSAQGVGKTHVAAGLVLWWLYARGPSAVVCLAPTERQVRELLFGEIRSMFLRVDDLPGELFQQAVRVSDANRHFAVGFSTRDAARLTGFHHPRLLVVIDEAHGLDAWMWEAVFALVTGEHNKVLAIGNPGPPTGKWFDLNRSDAWAGLTISALEHPNVVQGREVVPGAVSSAFIEDVRREYGEGSATFMSRVLGEFADEGDETLVRRSWLDAAADRWASGALEAEAYEAGFVFAVDPARFGPDHTALAVRQGPVLREIVTWGRADTMETTGKIVLELQRRDVWPSREVGPPRGYWNVPDMIVQSGEVVIDEVGVGGGVVDRLREVGYAVTPFNGGRSPRGGLRRASRFLNLRAQSFWHFRRLLEEGEIALPRDEKLFDELLAIRWSTGSDGKIRLERKDDTRARLGRSPDRADAVAMAFGNPT